MAALSLAFLLAACASSGANDESYDPLEKANRGIYKFNDVLDKVLVEPLSTGYVKITPKPVRTSVSNFFDNASYPGTILSDFLQGKGKQGASDTGRFLVNGTLGVAGLFDVATSMGMEEHDEDFGQTLGVWGANQGAYLVLPLLGPNTVRDTPDLAVSTVTSGLFWAGFYVSAAVSIPVGILSAIDERARAENSIRFVNEMALDPYLFSREAWTQHRTFLIYDGDPPVPEFDDEFGEPGEDTP
ncbi:MAG: VacJ family lipoprotein [Mariprofundaceae bacterium]